jgi:hypothetical protein
MTSANGLVAVVHWKEFDIPTTINFLKSDRLFAKTFDGRFENGSDGMVARDFDIVGFCWLKGLSRWHLSDGWAK